MEILYTASAHSTGGRQGSVETDQGNLRFKLATPAKDGLNEPNTTNPEQLFASGYAACFGSAIDLIAKQKHITLSNIHVVANVSLGKENAGYMLSIELKVFLPGVSHAEATHLVQTAHTVCPYSKATRNNIDVALNVVDSESELS